MKVFKSVKNATARILLFAMTGVATMVFGHNVCSSYFRGSDFGDFLYTIFDGPLSPLNPLFLCRDPLPAIFASVVYATVVGKIEIVFLRFLFPKIKKNYIWLILAPSTTLSFLFPNKIGSEVDMLKTLNSLSPETKLEKFLKTTPRSLFRQYHRALPIRSFDDLESHEGLHFPVRSSIPTESVVFLKCAFRLRSNPALATSRSGLGSCTAMLFFSSDEILSGITINIASNSPWPDSKDPFSNWIPPWTIER